jgi:hypothetical protein
MKRKRQRQREKPSSRPHGRAKFLPISEEMKQWSAILESEIISWPGISTKSMFGFLSFYRRGTIFAALPQTRGFASSSSLIVKFDPMPPALLMRAQGDPRMDSNTRIPGKGWFSFELNSESDLREALRWLNQAYEAAKKGTAR